MTKRSRNREERIWMFVVDSRNLEDLRDLDHLDGILWGSNPNTRRGDLVLMYRTAPYSDIAYIFRAKSNPRKTRREDGASTDEVIVLTDKVRLINPLTLHSMKQSSGLSEWSFLRYQQGIMRRRRDIKEEGVWPVLRRLLLDGNPIARRILRAAKVPSPRAAQPPLNVFLSYGSEDCKRVKRLYNRLSRQKFLKLWFDRKDLVAGDAWEATIDDAIRHTGAVTIFLSARTVRKKGFFQTEIGRALKIADEQPEGTSFILPAKIEPCELPRRLSRWQCVELFRREGFRNLLRGLRRRQEVLAECSQLRAPLHGECDAPAWRQVRFRDDANRTRAT
jgi:hypothetical protein